MAGPSAQLAQAPRGGTPGQQSLWGQASLPRPRAVAAIATALVAVGAATLSPAHAIVAAALIVPLLACAAVDLESRLIPNRIVVPAMAVVLALQLVLFTGAVPGCLLAALTGAVLLFLPRLVNPGAVGMGDVKLAMLLGLALGWGALAALLLASLFSVPFALTALVRGGGRARTATLPFGPFMALGALVVLFLGQLPS